MKINHRLTALLGSALLLGSVALAAEKEKEITLTGMGQCAKCSLKQTSDCQNALVIKNGGKDEVYLLTENDVSKKFHDNVCTDVAEIKVTGVVKEVAGKKEITASKIELAKK